MASAATLFPQVLTLATLAGLRASYALLGLALLALRGGFPLPPELSWMGTPLGVAALLGVTFVEGLLERDEDAQELLAVLNYAVRGGGGVAVAWCLRGHGVPWPAQALLAGAAAMATHHLRMRLHALLRGWGNSLLNPRDWLLYLESGGALGVLVAVVLMPVLALVLVLLGVAATAGLYALRVLADRKVNRLPCEHCGHRRRREARRCPACRGEVAIERWLIPQGRSAPRPPDTDTLPGSTLPGDTLPGDTLPG